MNVYVLGDSISYITGSWVFQLADKLPCERVFNLARGGATYADGSLYQEYSPKLRIYHRPFTSIQSEDGKTESYPANYLGVYNALIDCGPNNQISNQVSYMERLIRDFNRPTPDLIVIACGINDAEAAKEYSDSLFQEVIATPLEEISLWKRKWMEYGILSAILRIKKSFPLAKLILTTPIPSNYSFLRPYIPNVKQWLLSFGVAFQIPVIDGDICGIDVDKEKGATDHSYVPENEGVYLYDGLHPNQKGNELLGDYFSSEIRKIQNQ